MRDTRYDNARSPCDRARAGTRVGDKSVAAPCVYRSGADVFGCGVETAPPHRRAADGANTAPCIRVAVNYWLTTAIGLTRTIPLRMDASRDPVLRGTRQRGVVAGVRGGRRPARLRLSPRRRFFHQALARALEFRAFLRRETRNSGPRDLVEERVDLGHRVLLRALGSSGLA